jgi:hypothetical protein
VIVKKIPAHCDSRHVGVRRAKHARDLVDYMRSPEKESPLREHLVAYMAQQGLDDGPERLIHIGARNFVSDDLDGQRAEMMAVAQAAVRTPNPIDHWLLSWQEGEIPSAEEVDEAVELFVDRLGLAKHQVIYAVHGDTHNRHCHIALNRYDPLTRKVITIHKGFWREASHQAVAEIVARFRWKAEPNARYEWVDGAAEMSAAALAKVEEGLKPLRAGASRFEIDTGYRSAQRIAQDEAWPIIRQAKGWEQIHTVLASRGIRYDPVGTNGATITVGSEVVKASDVNRYATIKKLEKRLGSFQPRCREVVIAPRQGSDRFAGAFRADEYRSQCDQWQAATPEQRAEQGLSRPAPNLETFLHQHAEHEAAENWRKGNRDSFGLSIFEAQQTPPGSFVARVGEYVGHRCAESMRYARPDEATAFVDTGKKIIVLPGSDEALMAALELAILRFEGRVVVTGNDVMQQRVWKLAIESGLHEHLASQPPSGVQLPSTKLPVTSVTATARAEPEQLVSRILEEAEQAVPEAGIIAQAEALRRRASASGDARSKPMLPLNQEERSLDEAPVTSVTTRRSGLIDQARKIAQKRNEAATNSKGVTRKAAKVGSDTDVDDPPRRLGKGPRDVVPAAVYPPSKDRGR